MNMAAPDISHRQYDRVTIAFHWVTVLLVIILVGTAWLWQFTPREWHMHRLESLHVSLGILFTLVVLGRLAWRAIAGRRLPSANSGVMDFAAKAVHWLLYVLLGLEAVLGFVLRWFQAEDFSFFGLFQIPDPLAQNKPIAHLLEDSHNIVAWAIVIVVAGHAAAALYHHYVLKDRLLARMSPASAG